MNHELDTHTHSGPDLEQNSGMSGGHPSGLAVSEVVHVIAGPLYPLISCQLSTKLSYKGRKTAAQLSALLCD